VISEGLNKLDDMVKENIEVCRVEIPEHSQFLLDAYSKYYSTATDSFMGFSVWKNAVFCSLRTKFVTEVNMDLSKNATTRG
tara:strand:+ start:216 stop:458 length:243 start_codon:yes stop_codon:yes gene_type:complete